MSRAGPRREDDEVIHVHLLSLDRAGAVAEAQLHGVEFEDGTGAEAQPTPRAPLHAVDPEHLQRVGAARGVQLHPELDVVPRSRTHRERGYVGLSAVSETPPARDAVGFPGHRRVITVEPRGSGVAAPLSNDPRTEEVRTRGTLPGLSERRPLIVGARAV